MAHPYRIRSLVRDSGSVLVGGSGEERGVRRGGRDDAMRWCRHRCVTDKQLSSVVEVALGLVEGR
jgi:hypothetical protein